jgi:plastocyanin
MSNDALVKGIIAASLAMLAIAFVTMVIFMIVMMGGAMGGMMSGAMGGMMGGGSNPADEAAVEGVTQVRQQDFAFAPANIIVDEGTTVTWTNRDSVGHTVTSDGGGELQSPLLGQKETFSYTFDEPGRYSYFCSPHPYMKGLVTVREAGAN